MPLPLYGFVEGDTVGVLIIADEHESVESLKQKLRDAVSLRVATTDDMELVYRAVTLDPAMRLDDAQFAPLQRFDLRRKHGVSQNRNLG
jgi:hypothetical protein